MTAVPAPDLSVLVVHLDDDPRAAARQVDAAGAEAEAAGRPVHLVHEIDPPSAGGADPLAAREALDALARRLGARGVPTTSQLVTRRSCDGRDRTQHLDRVPRAG
jgi:hypothetical protein